MFTPNEAMWFMVVFMIIRFLLPVAGLLAVGTWMQHRQPGFPYV